MWLLLDCIGCKDICAGGSRNMLCMYELRTTKDNVAQPINPRNQVSASSVMRTGSTSCPPICFRVWYGPIFDDQFLLTRGILDAYWGPGSREELKQASWGPRPEPGGGWQRERHPWQLGLGSRLKDASFQWCCRQHFRICCFTCGGSVSVPARASTVC